MSDGSPNAVISAVSYGPAGELLSMTGWNYSEGRGYNSRLQLTSLNGATFSYGADATSNGRIVSETVSGETVAYAYDSLNRLISANGPGWGQGFGYDGFGNLTAKTVLAGSVPTFSGAFDAATNRQAGVSYDANGNQLTDRAGAASLQYDVENRLVFARNGWSSPGWWYGYDPDNRRV
jgi:YD repeat-containing protein